MLFMREPPRTSIALPAPAPLPSLTSALSRRSAIFGAVVAPMALAGSATCAQGFGTPAVVASAKAASFEPMSFASADVALIELAARVAALASRRHASTGRIERLELQVEAAHPRPPLPVSNDVFRAYRAETQPTEDRIGLTLLRRVRRRMAERLDRWAADLAAMEAATLAGLGAKAAAVLTIDDLCGDDSEGAERLTLSLLHDAMRLGGGVHA